MIEMQVMNKLEKLSKDLSSLMLLTYHVDVMSKIFAREGVMETAISVAFE